MSENRMNTAVLAKIRIIVCPGHYAVFRIIRRSHIPKRPTSCPETRFELGKIAGLAQGHFWGRITLIMIMINKSSVWQPAARGHRAYTDLSAARVRGPALCTVCSLVNWEMTHS